MPPSLELGNALSPGRRRRYVLGSPQMVASSRADLIAFGTAACTPPCTPRRREPRICRRVRGRPRLRVTRPRSKSTARRQGRRPAGGLLKCAAMSVNLCRRSAGGLSSVSRGPRKGISYANDLFNGMGGNSMRRIASVASLIVLLSVPAVASADITPTQAQAEGVPLERLTEANCWGWNISGDLHSPTGFTSGPEFAFNNPAEVQSQEKPPGAPPGQIWTQNAVLVTECAIP
jgi:hypothetical protein